MTTVETEVVTVPPRPVEARHSDRAAKTGVAVIGPISGWPMPNFRELWQFRGLLYFLAWRDVKVRYKQTALGAAWAIIQPAMLMIVFTSFLGRIAKVPYGDIPYPLFVYLGVLPWTFFATAITASGHSVVGSERLVTKIYFPRLAIPIAAVGAAVVDFTIGLGLLMGMMLYYGVVPGMGVMMLPLIFAAIALTALGVGMSLAALNVLYRDFRYVIPFIMQVWMFGTPTIYMSSQAESSFVRAFLHLNPMVGLVSAFRCACIGEPINYGQFSLLATAAVVIFACGCCFFRRLEIRFADVI
jgi:lipopolysaccharide transport system permease protein